MRMREDKKCHCQTGGITILVALFLLVLLTISALAMSGNSLREAIISGTVRQGTEVRNVADNGIEWSCYWLNSDTTGLTKAVPDVAATAFREKVDELAHNPELRGFVRSIDPTGVMTKTESSDGATRAFKLDLTLMGKLQIDMVGGAPSTGAGAISKAVANELMPDIWSVRSTGTLDYSGVTGATFQHSREAWLTVPPQ